MSKKYDDNLMSEKDDDNLMSKKGDDNLMSKKDDDKHNAELQRADPGTKDTGHFSTRGSIFPHDAQNRLLSFPSF